MLKIVVPADGPSKLTFSAFVRSGIAAPVNGAETEGSDTLLMQFDDEAEAVAYTDQLLVAADQINDKTTTKYLAINDIIAAIRNDRFVQQFNQE